MPTRAPTGRAPPPPMLLLLLELAALALMGCPVVGKGDWGNGAGVVGRHVGLIVGEKVGGRAVGLGVGGTTGAVGRSVGEACALGDGVNTTCVCVSGVGKLAGGKDCAVAHCVVGKFVTKRTGNEGDVVGPPTVGMRMTFGRKVGDGGGTGGNPQ